MVSIKHHEHTIAKEADIHFIIKMYFKEIHQSEK